MATASPRHVIVCGAGVIGASVAYFLTQRGIAVTVIERTGVACAASGKSGGFLALDWCDGSPLAPLARRSFALHADLAAELGNDWGYRRLTTYGGYASAQRGVRQDADAPVEWLSPDVVVNRRLGATDTTAQVHPGAFTAALMRAAQAQGA
jgi:glycine/D-amino acid oxidase-like deaminating enzyme